MPTFDRIRVRHIPRRRRLLFRRGRQMAAAGVASADDAKTGAKWCMAQSERTAGSRRTRMRGIQARQNRSCRAAEKWRMTCAALGLAMECDAGAAEICRAVSRGFAERVERWKVERRGRIGRRDGQESGPGCGAHRFSRNLMRFGARALGDREKIGLRRTEVVSRFTKNNNGRGERWSTKLVSEVRCPCGPITPMSD